jgi:hypothetical protein
MVSQRNFDCGSTIWKPPKRNSRARLIRDHSDVAMIAPMKTSEMISPWNDFSISFAAVV